MRWVGGGGLVGEVVNNTLGIVDDILIIRIDGRGLLGPLEGPRDSAELGPIAGLRVGVQRFAGVPLGFSQ